MNKHKNIWPHCQIKTLIVFFILFGLFTKINAQSRQTFKQTDSTTYALYLKGDWNKLIDEAKTALTSGYDYYYMRMRLAYAYYMKENYRAAIPHYQKALEFNNDSIALQFLINSYEYGGRSNDAIQLAKSIPDNQLIDLQKKYENPLKSIGLFYAYHNGISENSKSAIEENVDLTQNGIQKITNHFHVFAPALTHSIGNSILINHSLSYMNKNEDALWIEDETLYYISNQTLTQWNYNIQALISLWSGLSIMPVLNTTSITIPPPNQYVSTYKETYLFTGIKLQEDIGPIKVGASYAKGQANKIDQKQLGAHLIWFIKGNLNLYYSLDAYFQNQYKNDVDNDSFIHQHTIGFKVLPTWWMEACGTFPEFSNVYDINTGILYNGLENINNKVQLRNYLLPAGKKLKIILDIGYYQNITQQTDVENNLIRTNKHTYNVINFTGGLIWKL